MSAWALLLALLFVCALPLRGAEPEVEPEASRQSRNPNIVSAYVSVQEGVYLLNVRTLFPLTEDIRRALDDGVTLNFQLQALVQKSRHLWYNATLVDATVRRELSWHAVSGRYVLRDVSLGSQQLFTDLDEALIAAGTVQAWPVVVEPQLEPDGAYVVDVRVGMARGRLSGALRLLRFWSNDWSRDSGWHELVLPR